MSSLRIPLLALLLAASLPLVHGAATPEKESKTEKPLDPEAAQKAMKAKIEAYGWTRTGKGKLGTVAEIDIPQGYRFTGKSGSQKMMELFGNIPNNSQTGMISPEDFEWSVLFSYSDVGYVKDTDKNSLDAAKILTQLKEGQEEANEARASKGLQKLYLDGWAIEPRYNETTHNLEWAVKIHDDGGNSSINYLTKLLGRKGVMNATLLVDPAAMKSTLPIYQKLIAGFGFTQGQSYAEYRQGDKVAQYALTGLITAGAGIALAKSGWLAKFALIFAKLGKATYLLVVGAFAALKKLVMKLFGKNDNSSSA